MALKVPPKDVAEVFENHAHLIRIDAYPINVLLADEIQKLADLARFLGATTAEEFIDRREAMVRGGSR